MDVETSAPIAAGSPISSSNLRSSLSAGDASSNSVGSSSLDTASASAHLERYDVPWALSGLGVYRGRMPRRTRSYSAFLDWHASTPMSKTHMKHVRPLAGTSRKRLIRQIQQLTQDKADLQAQLAAMFVHDSASDASPGSRATERGLSHRSASTSRDLDISRLADEIVSGAPGNPYPFLDGLVGYPSTLTGPEQTLDSASPASLEHIAALASRLRVALETSTTDLLDENDAALLERPGMRAMLLKRRPNPERAQLYARFFSKRFIEMQKKPENRCKALQLGLLQQSVKHPGYVNILMKGLREPFIAHMGAFDEAELGLWILNGVEFHSDALGDNEIEIGDLDDDFYEFSSEFFKRFPFTGTKEMIDNANKWRGLRGEPLLVQTSEMAAAEEYTRSRQIRVLSTGSQH